MFNNLKKFDDGRIATKVLAVLLVIMLTGTNFILLGSYMGKALTSYAVDVDLENQDNSTNSDNVKFNVYLDSNDTNKREISKDINSEDLIVYVSVSVQDGGYLNNAKINIKDTNFRLKNNVNLDELKLDSMQSDKGITLELPVVAVKNESFNLSLLDMVSQIKLTGEYIDSNGQLVNIDSTKGVKISWNAENITDENNPIKLSQEVITNKVYNIAGTNKRVIQLLVKSGIENNSYPIKNTQIELNAPVLAEIYPEKVVVASYDTIATNGKNSMEFGTVEEGKLGQWSYNADEHKTTITVENRADANNNVTWIKNGEDKFVVTYIYDENADTTNFASSISNKVYLYETKNTVLTRQSNITKTNMQQLENTMALEMLDTTTLYKGNMYLNKDTDYQSKYDLYVSYSDLANEIVIKDLENSILDENNTPIDTTNISTYYKTTKISKAQAINILGQEGTIEIYSSQDLEKPIQEINLSAENNEDYFTVTYNEGIDKIVIKTSKAIKEGNLEFINQKAIKVTSQENIQAIKGITESSNLTVKNSDGNEVTNVNNSAKITMKEPTTQINVSLDKTFLSTQTENELKITTELKTNDISNRLFENPVIRIELPKEITSATLENITPVLYDDELTLKSYDIVTNEAGNKELVIQLQGKQTKYSDSSVSGATIITDLKVSTTPFIADKDVTINTICTNATEKAEVQKAIKLVSKKGLITKNRVTVGENSVEKINQNTLNVTVPAESEVVIGSSIINNFGESISNINVIGKIAEGTLLKEAITTSIPGVIISYSEESAPDTNSASWKTQVENYNNIKSFKLSTENTLEQGALIEINYKLGLNKDVTSLATNSLDVNYVINEQAKSEQILFNLNPVAEATLIDSDAPNGEKAVVSINPKTTTNVLHEGQIVTYEIKAKNTSGTILNNLVLDYTIPQGTVYTELESAQATEINYKDDASITNKTWSIETIQPGETITKEVTIRISNGTKQVINTASLKDQENNTIAETTLEPVEVKTSNLAVMLSRVDNMLIDLTEGSEIQYIVLVTNNSNTAMNNLTVTSKVPNGTTWIADSEINSDWQYDSTANKLQCKIDTLGAGETKTVRFEVEVDRISGNSAKTVIGNTAVVTTEDGEEYETNVYNSNVIAAKWDIHMTSENNKTLNEGDSVKYIIKVTNIGERTGTASVTYELPEEIQLRKLTYYINETDKQEDDTTKDYIEIQYTVEPNETLTIIVEGVTYDLEDNVESKEIKNIAKLDLGNDEYLESEEIVNTIVNDVKPDTSNPENSGTSNPENPTEPSDPENPDSPDDSTIDGSYSISGTAWLDENKNGVRDDKEKVLPLIKVLLLDKTGKQIDEAVTSLTGTYKFSNLASGEYMVAFVYDTNKYAVTKYQIENAEENINSDVISKEIQLEDKATLVGITDVIKIAEDNLINIDIGLIENAKFDLSLDKYITKVVVINDAGTSTYTYENTELAKVEISAKQLANSVVIVEYEIKITNNGDVDGYVNDIIDYIPKELEYSSDTAPDWYMDSNGDLHNITLAEKPIAPGKTETVKLVLTRTLKSDSTGTIENTAEIGVATNLEALEESDSVAGNKKDGEDDIGKASLIISIKTGSAMLYIGIVLLSIAILGIGIYIINKKVLKERI